MRVELKEGTLKVITEVKKPICIKLTDKDDNEYVAFTFAQTDGMPTEKMFKANASVDGCLAFITSVNTDDEKALENVKKVYGKAILAAKDFEVAAKEIIKAEEVAAKLEADAIDALFA